MGGAGAGRAEAAVHGRWQRSLQRGSGFGAQKEVELANRNDRQTVWGCHRRNTGPLVPDQSRKVQMGRLARGSSHDHAQHSQVHAMSNTKSAETERSLDLYREWALVRREEQCALFAEHQAHGDLPVTEPIAYAFVKKLYELERGLSAGDLKGFRAAINKHATADFPATFTVEADRKHGTELAALRHSRGVGLKKEQVDKIDGKSFDQMEGHVRLLHEHNFDEVDDEILAVPTSPAAEDQRFHEIELQYLQVLCTGVVPSNWDEQGLVEWTVQRECLRPRS